MSRFPRALFLLLILLTERLAHGPAQACDKAIEVALTHFPPVMRLVPGQAPRGETPDLLDAISKLTGCLFRYTELSRPRALQALEADGIDLVTPVVFAETRGRVAQFIPLGEAPPALIARRGALPREGRTEALLEPGAGQQLGLLRNAVYDPQTQALVDQLRGQGRVQEVSGSAEIARLLLAGRVDLSIVPPVLLFDALEAAGRIEDFEWAPLQSASASNSYRYGLYVSRQRVSEADRARLATAVAELLRTGEYQRILARNLSSRALPYVQAAQP